MVNGVATKHFAQVFGSYFVTLLNLNMILHDSQSNVRDSYISFSLLKVPYTSNIQYVSIINILISCFLFILTAVECGSLVMPMNASSYGELTTYPNKVYFQCDEGFVLKGSSVRVCLANGSWSGNDTSCEGVSNT